MNMKEIIYNWVADNYGESEANDPSWNIDLLAEHIESKLADKEHKLFEQLEEIQSICIGADSPDAHEHAERDPIEELQCCQQDLGAISNIVEKIQSTLGE